MKRQIVARRPWKNQRRDDGKGAKRAGDERTISRDALATQGPNDPSKEDGRKEEQGLAQQCSNTQNESEYKPETCGRLLLAGMPLHNDHCEVERKQKGEDVKGLRHQRGIKKDQVRIAARERRRRQARGIAEEALADAVG